MIPTPAPPSPALRRRCLSLLLAALACLLLAGPAGAAPVRTALAARTGDGAWRFLTDLSELWRHRYEPTDERLALRRTDDALARLEALARGRGDFAVVDGATAARHLARHPPLTALAVLWPNLLTAVGRNPAARELSLPLAAELWVLDSAAFVQPVLDELIRRDPARTALPYRIPEPLLSDALDYAQEPLLLFTAPVPLLELTAALARDPALQVLPIAGRLVEELRLEHPWLVTEKLGRGSYPGLARNLELPAVYQILVGRRDLPPATVRKVLDTVYGRSNAMALFNPLFGQTDSRMNAVFGKLMPFHPVTARVFNFTPSVP